MLVLEQLDQNLYDRVQEKNLIRQYDLLTNCIEIGLQQDHTAFDKYMLWSLIAKPMKDVPAKRDPMPENDPESLIAWAKRNFQD
jgi:hypothetical protein